MLQEDCPPKVYSEKVNRLSTFVDAIETETRCIRQVLLLYLDEIWNSDCLTNGDLPCTICDKAFNRLTVDVTAETLTVLNFLTCQSYIRELDLVETLYGTFHKFQQYRWVYGSVRRWYRTRIVHFIQELRLKGLIVTNYEVINEVPLAFLVLTDLGRQFLMAPYDFCILVPSFLIPSNSQALISFRPNRVVKRRHHVMNKRFKPKEKKKKVL